MRQSYSIDPNHGQKRQTLTGVGTVLLVIGIPCALIGVATFLSVFFTSSSEFFANPNGVMDRNSHNAVIGMILIAGGGFASMIGLKLVLFARAGSILRYGAAEAAPVVKDVARDVAPVANQVVRGLAQAVRDGLQTPPASADGQIQHTCGTWNDPHDRFCKGCGEEIGQRFCPKCGQENDADARFCDKCGAAIAQA